MRKMDEKPYNYNDLIQESVTEIADLLRNEGYQPPLDVNITDKLGRIVVCMEMDGLGSFSKTTDTWKLLIDAVLPFFVTVVDREGRVWKKTFGEI
jgi:hypothetical protein